MNELQKALQTNTHLKVIALKITDTNGILLDGKPLDESAEILDAYLKATNTENGITTTPKVGATAYVLMTTPPIVIAIDEIDEQKIIIQNTTQKINSDGFLFQKGNTTLNALLSDFKEVLSDINSTLETFKVICSPAGTPSTTPDPTTLLNVQKLKPKITKLQTDIDNLLQ